jgi:hypothetical protein
MTGIFGCQQSLEVTSLPQWGGVPNPQGPARTILLVVADGGGPFPDSAYTVDRIALDCDADAGRGCGAIKPDEYALVFASKISPPKTFEVRMGETTILDIQPPDALGRRVHATSGRTRRRSATITGTSPITFYGSPPRDRGIYLLRRTMSAVKPATSIFSTPRCVAESDAS